MDIFLCLFVDHKKKKIVDEQVKMDLIQVSQKD